MLRNWSHVTDDDVGTQMSCW